MSTWHVPKGMLISNLEPLSHTGELQIAAASDVGAHDDLVLCVAIALWTATNRQKFTRTEFRI